MNGLGRVSRRVARAFYPRFREVWSRRAGVLLLALAMALLLWWPLAQSVVAARQQWQQQQQTAQQLAALQRAWLQLRQTAPRPGVPAAQLADVIRARAQLLGLDPQDWQIRRQGAGVLLQGEAGFDAWLQLLADLQTQAAVRVTDLQLDAIASGRVHLEAQLESLAP